MGNQNRNLVIRHLREVLVRAIDEADGNQTLSRHDVDRYEVKPCRYLALVARGKAILGWYKSIVPRSNNNAYR